jgi:hypothetical protein
MHKLNTSFIDKSNKLKERIAYCKRHLKGFLGKDYKGEYYKQCMDGKKHGEECEIIINKK